MNLIALCEQLNIRPQQCLSVTINRAGGIIATYDNPSSYWGKDTRTVIWLSPPSRPHE